MQNRYCWLQDGFKGMLLAAFASMCLLPLVTVSASAQAFDSSHFDEGVEETESTELYEEELTEDELLLIEYILEEVFQAQLEEELQYVSAGGFPVTITFCVEECARQTRTKGWELVCYNMCAKGRSLGCAGWFNFCTYGGWVGLTPQQTKIAREKCLSVYNLACFGKVL